jgi:arsenate reductase (thioredoxin)
MNIVFLCPHGVAKSVIAASYTVQFASESGLVLNISNAGTEPDAAIPKKVIDLLASQGLDVSTWTPKLVTANQLEQANLVISLGCDLNLLQVPLHKAQTWDVPAPSEDLQACHDAIKARVQQLILELHITP